MSKSYLVLVSICFLFSVELNAQVQAGRSSFAWLNLAPSGQANALAGWSLQDNATNPGLALQNPAMLHANLSRSASIGQTFLGAESSLLSAHYAHHLSGAGLTLAFHTQFVNYGTFTARDETGTALGEFRARNYSLAVSAARQLADRLTVGATIKYLGGSIDTYSSAGAAVDLGVLYLPGTSGLTLIGVHLRNAGALWQTYSEASDQLPFDFAVGITRKLKHLPLQVGLQINQLNRWNIRYDDPDRDDGSVLVLGADQTDDSDFETWIDNGARHLALNAELSLGKADLIQLRLGYDHRRQRELRVSQFRSLGGFSYGVGLNLRRIRVDYGNAKYHLAGGTHQLSLSYAFGPTKQAQ